MGCNQHNKMSSGKLYNGVLLGHVNDVYSSICAEMSGEPFSIIGVYYTDGNNTNALIYRIFDGTVYPFLTHEINYERLSTHQLVENMYIYEFDQEAWRLDGNTDLLSNRLKSAINRCVIQNIFTPDYKKLILNAAGITTSTIVNGYYRINEILLAISNEDPSKRKSSLYKNIVDCKYLREGVNIMKLYRKQYNDPSADEIKIESQKRLSDLATSVVNLICENPSYRHYLVGKADATNKTKGSLSTMPNMSSITEQDVNILDEFSSNTSDISEVITIKADIADELLQLKGIINEMVNSFTTGSNPVISVVDLIQVYNDLADKGNVSRIEVNQAIKYKSVGALLISGSDDLNSNEIKIELRSGEILYIPCTGEGIQELSDDEKLEVLRYVLSLRKATNSYNGLLDIIVQECANKSNRNQLI